MLLKELDILNCRKVKQAAISFHGPGLQIIQGQNGSGKSTIVQTIQLTLEGPKAFTPGMITLGETQAEVVAITDDGVKIKTQISGETVKQTISQYDKEVNRYITVSGGVRSFLEGIRSGFEMPWAMKDMTDAKIIEILKNRTGITQKINEIDAVKKDKELLRTDVGREKKSLGDPGPKPEKAEHPPKIDDLQAERAAAIAYLEKEAEILTKAANYIKDYCVFNSLDEIVKLKDVVDAASNCAIDTLKDEKKYTHEQLAELERQYSDWLKLEQKALEYDEYRKKTDKVESLTEQYNALTGEIEELREQRKKALSEMKILKGLEISEGNVLVHNGAVRGITDTNKAGNWSTAESVQVFFSIAARFAGDMKVIAVDNGESLDSETTRIIAEWADKSQFLVIILKVADVPDDIEEGIIYLREGEIVRN
jgi:DNA repair exonuclease SbcCD ATPase subunit